MNRATSPKPNEKVDSASPNGSGTAPGPGAGAFESSASTVNPRADSTPGIEIPASKSGGMAGVTWRRVRKHYALYPFLALFSVYIFYEIIQTLQTGVIIGGDPGAYLFAGQQLLHGRTSVFDYEYPLLPTFYALVILAFPSGMNAYVVADLMTGFIIVALYASGYLLFLRDTSSKVGGLVGGTALATIPLFMDEAGWGGQAQLVAIVLGILAVRRFLAWGPNPRLKDGFIVGLVLGLAALAEGWSTFFFLIMLAICVPLEYRKRILSRSVIKAVGSAVLPIALVYGYLYARYGSNVGNGLNSPWLLWIASQNSSVRLAERFAVGQPMLLYAYCALAAIWVVAYCLKLIPNEERYHPLLLPATVAFAIQALVLTSVYTGDRGIYFAALPLAIVFARMGASVRPSLRALDSLDADRAAASRRPFRLGVKAEASAAACVLAVLVLGLQVGFAGLHLTGALPYYASNESKLNQLTFLRDQTGGIVLVGLPSSGAWLFPYLYATGNPVYAAAEPTLLENTAQKEAVMNATLMQEGDRWIDAGGVRVADASDLQAEYTPGIFDYTGAYSIQTFYLNDALIPFSFSPVGNHSTIWQESPYYATSESTSVTGSGALVANYYWNTLNITKVESVDSTGAVHIDFNFQFINSFGRSIEMRLFTAPGATVGSTSNSSGAFSADVSQTYGSLWITQQVSSVVSIGESNISLASFQFVPKDQWGIPELQFTLNASTTSPQRIQINLTIRPVGMTVTQPAYVTEQEWFQSVNARWVVAPLTAGSTLLGRLAADPSLELNRTTADFEVFQVV